MTVGPDETRNRSDGNQSQGSDSTPIAGPSPPGEVAVPDGDEACRCPYCGNPFVRERYLNLHRGLAHPDRLTTAERTAFETAREAETAALRRFRILALGALVIVYFGFLFVFAIFA